MSRQRIWVINGVLALLLVWGGMRLRNDWEAFGASHQASSLQNAPARTDVRAPGEVVSPPAPDMAWTEIASRSPFSFDRNDTNLEVVEAVPQPVSGPKPVLLGTLLLGKERLALMGKPGTNSRSGSPVKVGQTFEGWQVVEIQDSSVVVDSNGVKESITVGRAAIERSSEKTSAPSQAPAAPVAAAPAATPARPAAVPSGTRILGTGPSSTPPAVVPPGARVVETPFGYKIEQEPK
jgi:hypothetical protein